MLPRPSSEPDLASIALSTGRVSGDSDRLKLQELKFTSVATSTLQIFLGLFSKTFPLLLVVTLLSKMDFFTSAASLLSNTFLQQLSKVLASTVVLQDKIIKIVVEENFTVLQILRLSRHL